MAINNIKITQSLYKLLILRSIRLRIRRISVVFLALMTGAAIITAMASVYFDINIKMSKELRTFGPNLFVSSNGKTPFTMQDYQKTLTLAKNGEVVASSPYLYGLARIDLDKVVLMGVDFFQLKKLVPFWQIKGQWVAVSFDENNAMIGSKLAKKLGLKIGQKINLIDERRKHSLIIKGIIETGAAEDNYLIVNIPLVQKWLHQENKINYAMYSVLNNQNQVKQFEQELHKAMPEYTVRPILKVSDSEGKILDKVKILMGVVSVIILILSTLCVNTTLTAMVSERRKEFALQKALGASKKAIMQQILSETAIITTTAIIIGLIIGFGLAQILGKTVFYSTIDLRWQIFPITVLSSVLAGLIAVIMPTMKAINYQPARVLKGE
ncbi:MULTISPECIES: ABC transporter permease [Pasteurellaceae]|uniref:FtsX-like permease family protein n=1 Tax=Pasteurella atlantica TaxID=2827233 RepID=A0AAW8CF24_9PAST|nr:FtsX-like permease family protein [Pasteurella atlantica]MBR0572641.1 ABC transporter permease [Pasteurella atlantica]MDP8038587.1 FtsX-like permease family protein [Pasteurella atlantica]MDP8040679.1 FtsX-like permease family protein [Pasteurella atlantica]MDP8042814.1 FtsX-like permease family protein [Pasteurella atlantica]MDP8044901.1 FtsX-like permease family protein [Pasteurella atlantica]